MTRYNGCGCGGHSHGGCNPCTSHNEIQQAVNDALALEKENLEQYENNAAQSATDAAKEAAKAAESASAAAQSQTNAETAASTATQAASSVTDTAVVLEETANSIKNAQAALDDKLSALQTKPVYFEVTTPGNTLTLSNSDKVFNVRSLYVASGRQDIGYGFEYDKATGVITLAEPITGDQIAETEEGFILVTVICDLISSDDPTSIETVLGSTQGASVVYTTDGSSVQGKLDSEAARLTSLESSVANLSADDIKIGNTTLANTVEHSLFEFMTQADIELITSSTGTEVNVDYAIKAAVAAGLMSIRVPWVIGVYTSGIDLATLPLGFVLWANSARRPYTVASSSSFNGTGVTWRTAVGALAPFISTGRHVFRGINFDGRDGTTQLLYSTNSSTQFNGSRFEGCGIYRFAIGLGWSNYTGTLFAFRCSISGNGDGVRNLIDSSVVDCVINANTRGIALLTGANNNNFADNRIEWNNLYNVYIYNAIQNVISGDLIDRSGSAGVVVSGAGSLVLSNLVLRRSGATVTLGDNYSTHIHLIDNGEIIVNGVRTGTGANDDGTGLVSPAFGISYSGSGTPKVTIVGSDMSGFVTQAENVKLTPSALIMGNRGINNRVTTGSSQIQFLRDCIAMKQATLEGSVGATSVFTLDIPVDDYSGPIQYGAYLERQLKIECRLSTASQDILKIPLIFRYEGSHTVAPWTSQIAATSTRIGVDSSATGVIVTYALTTDGKTLTVTLTSVDGIERKSRVTLLPS